jgi:hypothetical protein
VDGASHGRVRVRFQLIGQAAGRPGPLELLTDGAKLLVLAGLELAPRGGPPVLPDLCGGRLIPTVPLAVPSSPSPDRTNGLVRSRATCYTGSKQSDVWGFQGGTSMLHLRPNDSVVDGNCPNAPVVDGNWPNDSDDDNALAEFCYAVLIEVGVGLGALVVFVVFWVAAALLLHRLAS